MTVEKQKNDSWLHWAVLGIMGAWPFLSFLDHNRDDLPYYWLSIAGYGVAFVAFLFLLAWLGRKLLGSEYQARIANTLGVGAVCLFCYLSVAGPLSDLGISLGTVKIAIWLVLSLSLMGLTWRFSLQPKTSLVLFVIASTLIAIPVVRLVLFMFEAGRIDAATPKPAAPIATAASSVQPNVYWIILDAYPRADVLEAYFDHRNDAFIEALRKRAFFVADRSYANFASTKLSISTTGNMDYFLTPGGRMHPKMWTARLQGFNHAVDRFLARGYRYVHAGPGGNNDKTRCGGRESLCVTSASGGPLNLNEADVGLLRLTALYPMLRTLFPGLIRFDFNDIDNMISKLPHWPDAPVFAFVHILSPHPPRRYDKACKRVSSVSHDLVGEGSENTPQTFVNDLKCLNPEVIRLIDEILERDTSNPIILIQGDHGYRGDESELPSPKGPAIDRRLVRFANLNAMRLPERCSGMARHDITSVNTFRVVFSCLGDADLPQVEDQLFSHAGKKLKVLEINRGTTR